MNRPGLLVNLAAPVAEHVAEPQDAAGVATRACAAGFDGVGLTDSPRLYPDCFIETDRVLAGTPAALAGPCVVGLGLRHPATVAAALTTLGRRHGGRLLAVVGRGESSVRNEGLPVPGLSAYGDLLAGLVTACGELGGNPDAARLLGAASGPRTIALTAAHLGGVLIDVGVEPPVVAAAVEVARAVNPAVRCWLFTRAVPTRTAEEAREAAEPILGSCAARLVAAPGWYGLSPDLVDPVRRVADGHDYRRHGTSGARGGERAPDEVEAAVRNRFVLTGEPARLAARVSELTRLGIDGFVVAGALRGVSERLDPLGAAFAEGFAAA
jgi:alkanesulfonate monooxygenase SsuD/methylene tetrahydromethanopterin reductase-like flavin-dependent oxidoreductase (luciferase family)